MKQKRMLLGILLSVVMVLCLSACGGGGRADSVLEGKYVGVVAEGMGMTMVGDEIGGYTIELTKNGKGTMSVDDATKKCSWTNDDTTLTIKVEGSEFTGALITDAFIVDDLLDTGIKITYAKEGTDAANPEHYLPEDEKMMIGTWVSESVRDVSDEDVSDEVSPTALTVKISGNHTLSATFEGEDLGTATWFLMSDGGYINEDEYLLKYWEYEGDNIAINYSDGDNFWYFICTKQ